MTNKKQSYGEKQKRAGRGDSYGSWREGKQMTTEVIAGRQISNLRRGIIS